jgi:hypothetical protein
VFHSRIGRARAAGWALAVCVTLACGALGSCSPGAQPGVVRVYPVEAVDSLVVSSLESGRVVVLGDAMHGHGYYLHMLTSALDAWVDSLASGSVRAPRRLVLVLEITPEHERLLRHYLSSGDEDPLILHRLEAVLQFGGIEKFTTDEIEHYAELRQVVQRLDALNRGRPEPIELRIAGGEESSLGDYETLVRLGDAAFRRLKYERFITTRDSLVAKRVVSLLGADPGARALVFYGAAHLHRGWVEKPLPNFAAEPRHGFFLVHYLDAACGRNAVKVFLTSRNRAAPDSECVQQLVRGRDAHDFNVFTGPVPPAPCPVLYLRSRRVLDLLLGDFESCCRDTQPARARWAAQLEWMLWSQLSDSYLSRVGGATTDLEILARLVRERRDHLSAGDLRPAPEGESRKFIEIASRWVSRFDAVENIRRLDEWRHPGSDLPMRSLAPLEMNLPPVRPARTYDALAAPRVGDFATTVDATRDDLKRYMALQVMLIGTPAECSEAREFLRESTGLGFTTTAEWNAWWRTRYALRVGARAPGNASSGRGSP